MHSNKYPELLILGKSVLGVTMYFAQSAGQNVWFLGSPAQHRPLGYNTAGDTLPNSLCRDTTAAQCGIGKKWRITSSWNKENKTKTNILTWGLCRTYDNTITNLTPFPGQNCVRWGCKLHTMKKELWLIKPRLTSLFFEVTSQSNNKKLKAWNLLLGIWNHTNLCNKAVYCLPFLMTNRVQIFTDL
jgi:hypothetical protein